MNPAAPDRTAAVLSELEAVRLLLLTPDPPSMLNCESRLRRITAENSDLRGTRSAEIKSALAGIRFLLNSALGFWLTRRPPTHQPVQYVHGGSLLLSGDGCSFSIEL